MTKQQRFQQLLRSGELTRTDVQILQRHQQMLRQAQAVRQKQLHQRALQQQQQQQQQQQSPSYSGKSLPGKSVPGKTVPGKTVPGKSLPGKSVPGKSVPGKSVPGKSLPGKSVPGKTVPGKTLPGAASTPEFLPTIPHSPVAGKSLPVTSQRTSGTETPLQVPVGVNLPVNSPLAANLMSASPLNNIQSPVTQAVNLSVNQPVNRPVNQPVNQPVNVALNKPVNLPVNQSINKPINHAQNSTLQAHHQVGVPQGGQVNGSVNPTQSHLEQLKQQEQQRKLLQQRQQQKYFNLTAEQYEKLNPQQRQLLKLQYLRRKAKTQRFYESDQELLKKYENNPPSLDFHIHEEHYRFGHNENLIPKNDPAIKEFLKFVAKKKIPDALMEIIKDGNIQLYDGNIILRIYDHRTIEDSPSLPPKQQSPAPPNNSKESNATVQNTEQGASAANESSDANRTNSSAGKTNMNVNSAPSALPENKNSGKSPKRFKEYRTILRLTQSALYEDFCLTTDTQMFGDSFVLTYESEILTATTRSVNLQPINNPYLQDKSLWPTMEMVVPQYDEKEDHLIFPHRDDMRELIDAKLNHRKRALTCENYGYKPLHQDDSQSNSKYEKLMLIMGKSLPHSNISTNKQVVEVPRFERLRFIENLRHQKLVKKENNLRGVSSIQSPPIGYTSFGSVMGSINGQKPFSFQNKNGDSSAGAGGDIKSEDKGGSTSSTAANSKGKGGKASAGKAATPRKKSDKPKKPRKPTKKQLAAQAAAQAAADGKVDGTSARIAAEPPKKKRAPPKKKNTANTPVTPAS